MAEELFDIAIVGSTPLAMLLAGLLASAHKRRVCLVVQPGIGRHIPSGIELSVAPLTRPDTWDRLKSATGETLKLLSRLGARAAVQRIDPVFAADTETSAIALSHMRHMALGFGYAVERILADSPVQEPGAAFRFEDAVRLDRAALDAPLRRWLAQHKVRVVEASEGALHLQPDGALGQDGTGPWRAGEAVLADDAAILAYAEAELPGSRLHAVGRTSLVTTPAAPLAAPVLAFLDRGVWLSQPVLPGRRNPLWALAAGGGETSLSRIGSCLGGLGPVRRAGQRGFRSLDSIDGAPVLGPLRDRLTVVAGFGTIGAFLAPALARHLAGRSSTEEAAYFAAQAPRAAEPAVLGDYLPDAEPAL